MLVGGPYTGLTVRLWDKGLATFNELRATYGLPPLDSVWDQLDRLDRVLVLTSPSFDIPAALPRNVHYVGPQLDDPGWAATGWRSTPGDLHLVMVALSSGFQDQLATLRRIVGALATLPVRAVVTTGLAIEPDELPSSPHVQIVRAAPHAEMLRHAAVVVTHGGHATLLKALRAGVPVACLPMGHDQPDNAARLVRIGASIRLRATPHVWCGSARASASGRRRTNTPSPW